MPSATAAFSTRSFGGRGYDADIEAYLKRRLPQLTGDDRSDLRAYESKLGWTRLHAAVDLGLVQLVQNALKQKVAVNAQGRDGRTALHIAAELGNAAVVQLLLNAKADPNLEDKQHRTPRALAQEKGHTAVIDLLDR